MRKFIIGSRTTAGYSIASHPVVHCSKPESELEARRLAAKHPDKEFVVMELISAFRASHVVTVDV